MQSLNLVTVTLVVGLSFSFTAVGGIKKPSVDEIKKVSEYFYAGSPSDIILSELKICDAVQTRGKNRFECKGTLKKVSVKSKAYVWMNFAVPRGVKEDNIVVHFNHGSLTRIVKQVKVKGSLRYRTWKRFALNKPGNWKIKVLYQDGKSVKELGSKTVKVVK